MATATRASGSSGFFHGTGRWIGAEGDRYEANGRRTNTTASAAYRWATGELTAGFWVRGLREGPGVERDRDGTAYKGSFLADLRHGHGITVFLDGGFHLGAWQEGRRHGYGEQVFADGSSYRGLCAADLPHGQGVFTPSDGGEPFAGHWEEGCFRDARGRGGDRPPDRGVPQAARPVALRWSALPPGAGSGRGRQRLGGRQSAFVQRPAEDRPCNPCPGGAQGADVLHPRHTARGDHRHRHRARHRRRGRHIHPH